MFARYHHLHVNLYCIVLLSLQVSAQFQLSFSFPVVIAISALHMMLCIKVLNKNVCYYKIEYYKSKECISSKREELWTLFLQLRSGLRPMLHGMTVYKNIVKAITVYHRRADKTQSTLFVHKDSSPYHMAWNFKIYCYPVFCEYKTLLFSSKRDRQTYIYTHT